ncbi:hypothetical protein [Halobaculum marinum]|uniref:Uncharacterized protein n=1 Tax=Halobaculum marinum TaxID=3031996 RepID=A0ABD5WT22_9EURY|nr:hypothetical protein [Halobaculum sp. DT55]
MSTVPRSPGDVLDDLPAHLARESAPPDRKGNIKCRICRRWVSIGPDGTEFGHARWGSRSWGDLDGPCPHRPDRAEPISNGPVPDSARTVQRDENGRFAGQPTGGDDDE